MRNQLASHVYDITYGSVRAGVDSLVCVDDSIVRGTTLRRSILGSSPGSTRGRS
jgi:amidophosphoribosyltransferase